MSLLKTVQTGRSTTPPLVCIYGTNGIGKTTWAAHAPGVVFGAFEKGFGALSVARAELSTYADLIQFIGELLSEKHDYKTAAFDSLDQIERAIWKETAKRAGKTTIEEIGYGKGYVLALDLWEEFLSGLEALREQRDMMAILVGHSLIKKFTPPDADPYDQYVLDLHDKASSMVRDECDAILFCNYKIYLKSTDLGFGREKSRAIGDGERVMFCQERPSQIAKNRLGLPYELPLPADNPFGPFAECLARFYAGEQPTENKK